MVSSNPQRLSRLRLIVLQRMRRRKGPLDALPGAVVLGAVSGIGQGEAETNFDGARITPGGFATLAGGDPGSGSSAGGDFWLAA